MLKQQYKKPDGRLDFRKYIHFLSHQIAFAISDRGTYYGVSAHLNTWNPKVENDNEFTNAQISVQGSPQSSTNKFEIIEFGWTVSHFLRHLVTVSIS